MTDVYSTSVAMNFDEPVKKQKNNQERKAKDKKPALSKEEFEKKIVDKIHTVIGRDGGSYAEFSNGVGLLVAGAKSKNKYYFIWIDCNRKIQWTDTKDTFHLLSFHPNMSIVDYLLRKERNTLEEIVKDFFSSEEKYGGDDKFTLVGEINFGNRVKQENRKKDKKKNNSDKKSVAPAGQGDSDNDSQKKKKKRTRSRNKKKSAEATA